MALESLRDLLEYGAAVESEPAPGITFYTAGDIDGVRQLSYRELSDLAQANTKLVTSLSGFAQGKVVVLYFDNHYDHIVWFWSVIFAGGIPAPCAPFSKIQEQRAKQIEHLHSLMDPIFLTSSNLMSEFITDVDINIASINQLKNRKIEDTNGVYTNGFKKNNDVAVLMLTSGSTGNSKAVCLTERQIIAAVKGKSLVRPIPADTSYLNWIGFDHVANLTEIHLLALYTRQNQVQVQASDIISQPGMLLRLINKHRVGRTFAPHFMFVKLVQLLKNPDNGLGNLDLSSLSWFGSGGEANSVAVADELTTLLAQYGAPTDVIVPGFGMTETCAGSIYNTSCPSYDLAHGLEFTGLGQCTTGAQMRVTAGELEVTGDAVFKGYYNDEANTKAAFTEDGWFKTGDQAVIDEKGNLRLVGRSKETININGVKYSPHEVESAIQGKNIAGIMQSYLACFAYRRDGMHTENICVVYAPTYEPNDIEARAATNKEIKMTVMLETGASPFVLPLSDKVMQKTTLGKLSRNKMKTSFEQGKFQEFETANDTAMDMYKLLKLVSASSPVEHVLLNEFATALEMDPSDIGVETPIFDLGVTSITLIKLKTRIEQVLNTDNVPIVTIMTNPTVRSLAAALNKIQNPSQACNGETTYNPVVVLQSQGSKTPLWLFHPGVGEILVFFNLAKYITDRPVYALRARGFEEGESTFADIAEAVGTYHAAIKKYQPSGPYAMAGYSYGAMLAFETAKRLQEDGETIKFMGSFNLPPHIKYRMEKLVWSECLLHLAYFLDLITEQWSREVADQVAAMPRSEAIDFVLKAADPERWAELSLTRAQLEKWVALSFGLQSMAREYEPSGMVPSIDVFCAEPLAVVAANREEWKSKQLERWGDFSETKPKIHDVDGAHYTMINEDNVFAFQKRLRKTLEARGI